MVRKVILILLALLLLPIALMAQKPTERERNTWMKELQQCKNEFISDKLDLTEEQKAKFLPVYNRMEAEIRNIHDQAMKMEREIRKRKGEVTDLEYEKAAEAQFELKEKESRIEMRYFKEFKTILSPKQLFMLKKAERDFSRELMKKHREHKGGKR